MNFKIFTLTAILAVLFTTTAYARSQVSIAGSSTVLPFATIVAEELGKNPQFKTPIVESVSYTHLRAHET